MGEGDVVIGSKVCQGMGSRQVPRHCEMDLLGGEITLRSKREFIKEILSKQGRS